MNVDMREQGSCGAEPITGDVRPSILGQGAGHAPNRFCARFFVIERRYNQAVMARS